MAKIFIETERLILRALSHTDAERLFLLDSNPEVMKYVGQPVLTQIEETQEVIKFIRKQYEENGIGRWAVIEKKSGLLIGWCGLKLITYLINGHQNIYDLGYRFLPDFWGKGYATESAKAVLKYGFEEMNLDKIYAYADVNNTNSNKILKEKLGFEEKGSFVDGDDNCFWYELTKQNTDFLGFNKNKSLYKKEENASEASGNKE